MEESQTWIESFSSGTDLLIISLFTFSFIFGCGIYYFLIYRKNRSEFDGKKIRERIFNAFSHVDDADTGPTPHIFAGVLTLVGISGLASFFVVNKIDPNFSVSLFLSVFSTLTVIFFAGMEIWTLWQTRRIFFSQGYVVNDFRRLIQLLTEELNFLESAIRKDHKHIPQDHHRVYIVAPHFFFGMLSYPGSDEEKDYRSALTHICRLRNDCKKAFDIEIICSTEDSITTWHEDYYSKHTPEEKKRRVKRANKKFSELVNEMEKGARRRDDNGKSIFTRLENLPKVQFMVVGNKLFEFTMNSGNSSTSIFNTQVISDSRQCNAYVEQFKFIKELSDCN